jgi:hypothetical protein
MTTKTVIAWLTRHAAPALQKGLPHDWQCIEFCLSKTSLSDTVLPESWAATNGRYVHELFVRVRERFAATSVLICNPAFEFDKLAFLKLLTYLASHDIQPASATVFSTSKDVPVAYLFPAKIDVDFRLSFLSTLSADLDQRLLSRLYEQSFKKTMLPWEKAPGRLMRPHTCQVEDVYNWISQRAEEVLSVNSTAPILGFNPHHAGDVLFACLAASSTDHKLDGLIVNEVYADIATDCIPQQKLSVLKGGCPHRNGWMISDEAYFLQVKSLLPEGCIPLYMRANGDYNTTYFHLIDHFAFAIGASPRHPNQLLWHKLPPRSRGSGVELAGKRILLHFDAGWPLKIYPAKEQNELIEMLSRTGNQITVLGKRNVDHGRYQEVAFEGYQIFKDLLSTQDAMVGMDSFPVHLAVHRLGIPAITLFGPTRPANSNAQSGSSYACLERGLPCNPCYALTVCGRDGGRTCANFAAPVDVFEALSAVVCDRETPSQHDSSQVPQLAGKNQTNTDGLRYGLRIALLKEYLRPQSYLNSAIILELAHALQASLQHDSPRMTWFKIKRFVRRRLRI